jgi:hypothetical protein
MQDNEKYLFDLQGYITVDNALDAAQLVELNRIFDEHVTADCEEGMLTHRFGGLLDWGPAYRNLIDNQAVVPYRGNRGYEVSPRSYLRRYYPLGHEPHRRDFTRWWRAF